MSIYRPVKVKIWRDGWFLSLTSDEKVVWIFLLTSEFVHISGIYELPKPLISPLTGVEKGLFLLEKFEAEGKIKYRNGFIFIKNYLKNQSLNLVKENKIRDHIISYLREHPQFVEWFELDKEAPYKPLISPSPTPYQGVGFKQVNKLTSKKVKLIKKGDEQNSSPTEVKNQPKVSKFKFEETDLVLARLLLDLIVRNTPTYKQPNLEAWANEIRLMREADKRTPEQIEYIIKWSQQDSFWKSNILSASAVRKQFDKMVAKIKSVKDSPVKGGITMLNV